MFTVSAAKHEGCQIFLTNSCNSDGTFSICGIVSIGDSPDISKLFNFGCKERRHHPHCSNATIGFNCFYVSKEFLMVGVFIDGVFLIMGE